ncbi:hypothetical protein [Streptomyces sp. NPDC044948]|uniref:hypothetical protein n=1 Tax=Streptomyces sp. NPDC044948 TaxID=3157092 RepID=UPI003409B17A
MTPGGIGGLAGDPGAAVAASAVFRVAGLAGFVLLAGGGLFACAARPAPPADRVVRRVLGAAWATASLATLGEVLTEMVVGAGPGGLGRVPGIPAALTPPGAYGSGGWAARLLLLAASWALGVAGLALPDSQRLRRTVTGATAVLLVPATAATWVLGGRPAGAATGLRDLGVRTVHLGAVGVWLGGSVMLGCALVTSAGPGPAVSAAWRFSRIAVTSLTIWAATSSYLSWENLGTGPLTLMTSRGQLLLAHIGGLTLLLALDALARACVIRARPGRHRRDRGGPQTTDRALRVVLHRSLAAQLALGATLLLTF